MEMSGGMDGLVAAGIVVRFGGLIALDGVRVEAAPGHITGLIGPNGAGKTTMFNVICGFQAADEGTVELNGVDVTKESPARRARMGLGRTFQRMELFRSLTVRENVALAAESTHVGDDPLTQLGIAKGGRHVKAQVNEITADLLDAAGLHPVADKLAGEVSTGQGRLVELARALARRPRILLLDEPSSGLDVKESEAFGELLVQLVNERGLGILMIEHDMSLVLKICDPIHVLDFGKPLMVGSPAEVRASDVVRDAYLGKADIAERV
ncbi:MAG: branched-chain amino acid transport system ATP-binding protein [Actinomycetota bacterium]|nr:branched-chain amino acid transport system ATP-binding protein [Actinomycetota bacterium]